MSWRRASLPGRLGNGLLGLTSRLFGALVSTLTVVVLTIYFMLDLPRLRRGLLRLLPRAHRAPTGRIADIVIDKVGGYMIGGIVTALLAGTSAFIVFTVLGVPYAVPLAIVVAACDLIPMIGATLGAVIGVLVTVLATWPTSPPRRPTAWPAGSRRPASRWTGGWPRARFSPTRTGCTR